MKFGMRKSAAGSKNKSLMQTYVSSMISLVLCCAMLLGTTMAWFTATVESKGHEIYIGTLDIDLLNEGVSLKDFDETPLFNDVPRWEPNATAIEQLTVKNEGDLAFKYKLTFSSTGSAIVNTAATDQFEVWVHPGAWTVTGNDYEDFTGANGWTKVGSLTEVLAGKTVFSGSMDKDTVVDPSTGAKVEHEDIYTVALHMVKEATGEGIMGKTVKIDVKLEATQLTSEADTFGPEYDQNAGFPGVPAAFVVELEDKSVPYTWGIGGTAESTPLEMDTAYEFKPTDTYTTSQTSPYRWWFADFVVSADKDVPANSVALAGYYKAWCDTINHGNWVAITNDGVDISANQEVPLVQSLGGPALCPTYMAICEQGDLGDSFKCGVAALTDDLVGTTITVELRLHEVENADIDSGVSHQTPTGKTITIGTFKYTFQPKPVAPWDGTTTDRSWLVDGADSYTISSAAQFVDFMNYCNETSWVSGSIMLGKTITLATDIDLGGATINGIADSDHFNGTFDGGNHTISNFKIEQTSGSYYGGLFGYTYGATIKNLTIADATVSATTKGQVGALVGALSDNSALTNCHVKKVTVTGLKKVGALVGYTLGSSVTDCSAADSTVYYIEKEGAEVIGYENTGSTVTNTSATNVTVAQKTI